MDQNKWENSPSAGSEGFAEPKYNIGEVSDLLNLHAQTIRFFEEEGIISPAHDRHNRRRKFSVYDIYILQLRKNYECLGFSLKETKDVLSMESVDEISAAFSGVLEELQRKLEWKTYLLHGLKDLQHTLNNLNVFLNRSTFRVRPAAWRHKHLVDTDLCMDSASCRARLEAIRLMPYARYSIRIPREECVGEEDHRYYCDVSVPEEAAVRYGFHKIPGAWYVPEQFCLYSVIRLPMLQVPQMKNHLFMQEFMSQEHLQLDGDVFCDLIINSNEDGRNTQYFETWIPVREADGEKYRKDGYNRPLVP